ncbi:MAG: hypothetical protein ACRDSN_16015 [Pseudonocardiaceae bacterium]
MSTLPDSPPPHAAIIASTTAPTEAFRRGTTGAVLMPVTSSDLVAMLDQVLEAVHQVNRALPMAVLGREELIAFGGLLTQIGGALLTLADLMSAPVRHYDRTRIRHADTDTTVVRPPPAASRLLRDCRDGFLAAYRAARACHADLRQCPGSGSDVALGLSPARPT